MLSISLPMKGVGQAEYYLKLAEQDYYTKDGNEAGRWFGKGAEALGLTGEVEPSAYRNVLAGLSPDGKRPLVQNASDPKRQTGWDLTLSAPKSVSVLWALGPDRVRDHVENAHRNAVAKTLQYLERVAGITRRGKGGFIKEPAGVLFATFLHGSSRALDPQLHTHCLLINLAVRSDHTTGAVQSLDFFRAKMTGGALYQVVLANELKQRLGVRIREDKIGFQIEGIPKDLCRVFSTRRADIERVLAELGLEGGKAAKAVSESTRPKKIEISRQELFNRWREQAMRLGWTSEKIAAVLDNNETYRSSSRAVLFRAFFQALKAQSEQSHTMGKLRGLAAKIAIELTADADSAAALLDDLRRKQWANGSQQQPSNSASRKHQHQGHSDQPPNEQQQRGSSQQQRSRQDPKQNPREHLSDEGPQPAGGSASAHTQAEQDRAEARAQSRNREQTSFGHQREPDHRLWTAAKISELDPREARTHGERAYLHSRYRDIVQTRAILNPIVAQPGQPTRQQNLQNRRFRADFADYLGERIPGKNTLQSLTHMAVTQAIIHRACPWTLFLTVRQLTQIADENTLARLGRRMVRRSTYRNIYHKIRYIIEPANKWDKILWQRPLFFADLRIQERRLFPSAPRINPLRELKLPAIRIKPKVPDWLGLFERLAQKRQWRKAAKAKRQATSHDSKRQSRDHSHSH